MQEKLLFFDIDGTIWNEKNEICDSTVEAIRLARKNGHKTFLCSGRSKAYINNPVLLDIGFDGIVSACGMMVEYHNEEIFYKRLSNDIVEETINEVRKHGCKPILEGKDYLYMDFDEFAGDYYGDKLRRELGDNIVQIKDTWGKWEVSKVSCDTTGVDMNECRRDLEDKYELIIHSPSVVEMVPKGYSKGTGILKVCEILGKDVRDTFAFGDSPNDIEMLKRAYYSFAVSNARQEAKDASRFLADSNVNQGPMKIMKLFLNKSL